MMAPAQDQLRATPSQLQTSNPPAPTAATQPATEKKIVAYTLPPDLYKKAHDRSRIHFRLALIGFVYGLVVLWVALARIIHEFEDKRSLLCYKHVV